MSFALLFNGKYGDLFRILGGVAISKSKLAYGKTMSTVGSPFSGLPRLNVKAGLLAIKFS